MRGSVLISAAVEGIIDEAVVRKLILEAGGCPGAIYGKNGKALLRRLLPGYNNAARFSPWIILVDLDRDAECAPPLLEDWLSEPATSDDMPWANYTGVWGMIPGRNE